MPKRARLRARPDPRPPRLLLSILLPAAVLCTACADASVEDPHGDVAADVDIGEVVVTPNAPVRTVRNIRVASGRSLDFVLRPPSASEGPAAMLVELLYDPSLHRENRPDPLLLAQSGERPDPFRERVATSARMAVQDNPRHVEEDMDWEEAEANDLLMATGDVRRADIAPGDGKDEAGGEYEPDHLTESGRTVGLDKDSEALNVAENEASYSDDVEDDVLDLSVGELAERLSAEDVPAVSRVSSRKTSPNSSSTTESQPSSRERRRYGHGRFQVPYRSDAESFIVWRSYAHLVLRNVTSKDVWHVRVLNHNGTVMNMLDATVRVTLERPPDASLIQVNKERAARIGAPEPAPYRRAMGYTLCPRGHSAAELAFAKRKRRAEDAYHRHTGMRTNLFSSVRDTVVGEGSEEATSTSDDISGRLEAMAGMGITDTDKKAVEVSTNRKMLQDILDAAKHHDEDADDTSFCSGRGACDRSRCICGPNYEGRYCESRLRDLPKGPFYVQSDEMVYFRYKVPVDGAVAAMLHILPEPNLGPTSIMSSQPILFAKRLGENGGRLLPRGPPLPTTYDTRFSDRVAFRARLPTQAVVRRFFTRGDLLYIGVFNYHRSAPAWLLRSRFGRLHHMSARRIADFPHRPVRVRLQVFPCEVRHYVSLHSRVPYGHGSVVSSLRSIIRGNLAAAASWSASPPLISQNFSQSSMRTGSTSTLGAQDTPDMELIYTRDSDEGNLHLRPLRACPVPLSASHWETSISFLMLPLMLGTFTMLTMVVCITTWARIFRLQILRAVHGRFPGDEELLAGGVGIAVHGTRQPRRDQLTDAEVNSMFPAFMFSKEHAAALGASGDPSCSVCLCPYEEGELLRRLGCGHAYHACCLDQWLKTNATCPRCRKAARIADVNPSVFSSVQHWIRLALSRSVRLVARFRAQYGVPSGRRQPGHEYAPV